MNTKTKEIYNQLIKGVENNINSESWKEFLKIQSKFHNYSFSNSILIYLQKPNATLLKGYKGWQELGRHVKKGEKGIRILAPIMVKDKEKENEYKLVGFKTVCVFDISQTEGKPLPGICKEIKGNDAREIYQKTINYINKILPVYEKNINYNGCYNPSRNDITIKNSLEYNHKFKTLIHEYTHYKIYNKEYNRQEHEIIAESVAYIVSQYFNIKTNQYSFEYVSSWSKSNPKEILKVGETIQKVAKSIIEEIEENLKIKKVA